MYQREFRRLNSLLRVFKKWNTLVTIITTSPTSPHHHVTTSPHHHITTSPRHHVTTSQHHNITTSHPHVPTSSHHLISHITPSHPITTSPAASSTCKAVTADRNGIASSSWRWWGWKRTKPYAFSHKVLPGVVVGNLVCATGAALRRDRTHPTPYSWFE